MFESLYVRMFLHAFLQKYISDCGHSFLSAYIEFNLGNSKNSIKISSVVLMIWINMCKCKGVAHGYELKLWCQV